MDDGSNLQFPSRSGAGRRPSNLAADFLHAQTETPPATTPRPPGVRRRVHVPQPLSNDGLRHYERVTDGAFMMPNGDWTTLPRVLISSDWSQSGILADFAEASGYPIVPVSSDHARWIATSRGIIPYRRGLPLWVSLGDPTLSPVLVLLPVLETEVAGHLGISMALGQPFIQRYFGDNWPPRLQPQAGGGGSTFPATV